MYCLGNLNFTQWFIGFFVNLLLERSKKENMNEFCFYVESCNVVNDPENTAEHF